jgi:putative membrane protein
MDKRLTPATGGPGRNYTPLVILLSVVLNVAVALLFYMPKYRSTGRFDLTFLPMLNAIFNTFTFGFLVAGLRAIKRKDIATHRRYILSAFTTTALFLVSYVTYHGLAETTRFGGTGPLRAIYFFVLITHSALAPVIVPLALFSLFSGLNMQVARHRKLVRWTMPLWLYVSASGVLTYLLIRPYY